MNRSHQRSVAPQARQPASADATLIGWLVRILGIAAAIYLAARFSQHLTVPPSNASPVWPGAGIALAVALLYGPRALIGVFLGVAAFEFQLFASPAGPDPASSLALASGLALGAALQAWVGAFLIRKVLGARPYLVNDVDILRFQLFGGPLACVTAASFGMLLLWSFGVITTANLPASWLTWWVGDTIGVIIFAPLVLIFLNSRDPLWRGRKMTVALPMLVLLATAIAFFSYANVNEKDEKQLKFNEQVQTFHNDIRRVTQRHLEFLDSLKSYFAGSESVTREEFHTFTEYAIKNYAGIQALEWIPRISDEQRAVFERTLPGNAPIRRLDANGKLAPAQARPEYYAIQFVEPSDGNDLVIGYDVTSNPVAAEALSSAIDSGQAKATAALKLVQDSGEDMGIVIYNPLYETGASPANPEERRQASRGVVAAVFRIGSLIQTETPISRQKTIALRLFDATQAAREPQLLYSSQAGAKSLSHDFVANLTLAVAGRQWRLEYSATPDFMAANTTWDVWVVLTGGLLVTALIGTGLLMLTGRSLRMEDEVSERTRELRTEVHQRRDAETQLRLVLDGAELGFWDWRYPTGEYTVNDRWLEMLGLGRDDVAHDIADYRDRIHPDDREEVLAVISRHIQENTGFVVEHRIRHRDGHWLWIQASGAVVSHEPQSGKPLRVCGTHQDITQRKQVEQSVRERESLLSNILDNVDAYIYLKDTEGRYLFANRAIRELWHADMEQIVGQRDEKFFDAQSAAKIHRDDLRVLTKGETLHLEEETNTLSDSGGTSVYQTTKLPLRHDDGEIYALCGISVDITRQKKHQKELEYIAHYDALTHLPNRVLLSDRLKQAMAQAHRSQRQLAVVYLDLDGFKPINDQYGHQVGDELLKAVAVRMKQTLRQGDTIARLGGDEFVAVLIDYPAASEGEKLLKRLLEAVARPVRIHDLVLRVSASLGVTFFPQSEEQDADQLLRQADQAMYLAKVAGKSRYHFFDSELDRDTRGRHKSLERIGQALAQDEFELYYQPKVNMRSGKLIGVEALIRWQHPEQGLLAPGMFLPVIEGHMLDAALGNWVMESALAQLYEWQAQGLHLPISVNVSSIQLAQPGFVNHLRNLLTLHPGLEHGSLEVEILETSALKDIDEVSKIMLACRDIGVGFSLDDFGTGYSSLTYLKRLPVSHLKIDRSFVRDMLDDPDDLSILEGVIGLANAFGLPTIAEGVETVEHGNRLLQLGCELAQGYIIARPMPAAEIPAWVETWVPPASWTRG